MPSDKRPITDEDRFTDHPHVTAKEAGSVKDQDGNELFAGDPGFAEAMAKQLGFKYKKIS